MHYKYYSKDNHNVNTTYLATIPSFDTLTEELQNFKHMMDSMCKDEDKDFNQVKMFYLTSNDLIIKKSPTKYSKRHRSQSPREVIDGLLSNTNQFNISAKQADSVEYITVSVYALLSYIIDDSVLDQVPVLTFEEI